MIDSRTDYRDIVKGEAQIIYDGLKTLPSYNNLATNILSFLESLKPPLASIEQKIGKNSTEYINISTEIVDVISAKLLYSNCDSADNIIEDLSISETVSYYANQRENLINTLNVFRKLEDLNMDYAYRMKTFNVAKKEIENRCIKKGIDIRTTTQKNIQHLKTIGTVTGVVAKETAGCAIELAIKIAIIIIIFLVLMTIIGVK